jgi:14-3-3 protein epsilon
LVPAGTIISLRTAWRALSSIQQKEESKGSKNLNHLKNYKKKIEGELDSFCDDILKLIKDDILNTCGNPGSKVFFLKMQGDYERYISEYATEAQYDEASAKAEVAYKNATEIAE